MIDKEKLFFEITKATNAGAKPIYLHEICDVMESIPEEPAIDFDALWNEFNKECVNRTSCERCKYIQAGGDKQQCFRSFLKSKNLSVPVKRELPVKTIYTLKKEYQDVFKDFGFLHSTFDTHSYEPPPGELKKYYDRTDELDYSQIPKGSVIEFNYGIFRRFVSYQDGYITYNDGHDQAYEVKASKVIRVVEWAKVG